MGSFDQKYYAHLAARIRKGDNNAFSELYEQTYQAMYRYVYYFLKNQHSAEDALQEIYISVWRNISSLRKDDLLYSWMKQIAYHICCDMLRRNRREQALFTEQTEDSWAAGQAILAHNADDPMHTVLDRETSAELRHALDKLPVRERQAFLLRYEHGLKLEEIADFMDASLASVKRYIARARESLQTADPPPLPPSCDPPPARSPILPALRGKELMFQ